VRSLLASPLGFLVGLSLGALGGGGSILAVPALVYGVGESAQAATATSLLVVGFAALVGVVPHWRKGHVRLCAGLLFGVAGIGGSFVGTALNHGVDEDVLLLAFSIFMVVAGVAMLRRSRRTTTAVEVPGVGAVELGITDVPIGPTSSPGVVDRCGLMVPCGPDEDGGALLTRTEAPRTRLDTATVAKVLAAGSVVGLLTGFFGVGGGFVIVPALVLTLGFAMPEAVGTSLVVIAINAAVALVMRAGSSTIDWSAALPFLVTAAAGTVIGGRIGERVDPRRLTGAFVVLLSLVAVYTGASAAVALAA
jgi:uncharacterized membrane protein YfcA